MDTYKESILQDFSLPTGVIKLSVLFLGVKQATKWLVIFMEIPLNIVDGFGLLSYKNRTIHGTICIFTYLNGWFLWFSWVGLF